jgi:hypothetical protein
MLGFVLDGLPAVPLFSELCFAAAEVDVGGGVNWASVATFNAIGMGPGGTTGSSTSSDEGTKPSWLDSM